MRVGDDCDVHADGPVAGAVRCCQTAGGRVAESACRGQTPEHVPISLVLGSDPGHVPMRAVSGSDPAGRAKRKQDDNGIGERLGAQQPSRPVPESSLDLRNASDGKGPCPERCTDQHRD